GLVGAQFRRHPAVQQATVVVDPIGRTLVGPVPERWQRTDEWYDFRTNPRGKVRVLATLDEATYTDGGMGADHPIAWCHDHEGGRSWYTGMGPTNHSFSQPPPPLRLPRPGPAPATWCAPSTGAIRPGWRCGWTGAGGSTRCSAATAGRT